MKQKTFYILGLIFLVFKTPFLMWAKPDVFQNYTQYLSYDNSFITGGNLSLSFGECKFSTDFENYNYGFSLFSEKYFHNFPFVFQGGNILIGGSVSRLKNPLLDSDVDGFFNCFTQPAVVTSQLPSFTSFTNPFSLFLELAYKKEDKNNNIFQSFVTNGSYTPYSHEANFAAQIELNITEGFSLREATGISLFNIEEKPQTTWYSNLPYYKSRQSIVMDNQIAFNIFDIFQSNLSVFIYENPFRKYFPVFKLENIAQWDKYKISLSAFINTNKNLITNDNIILNPLFQIKSNFQFSLPLSNEKLIKSGCTFYCKMPLELPLSPDIKFGIRGSFHNNFINVNCQSSFSFKLHYIEENEPQIVFTFFSSSLETIWDLGKFKPNLTLSSRLYLSSAPKSCKVFPPPVLNTQSYSINTSCSFLGDFIAANSSFSFSCKNHEFYNKKLKFGISLNETFKKIIVIVKFNGEFCI